MWLNKNGWYAWKVQNGAIYDAKTGSYRKLSQFHVRGISDAIAVSDSGVVVFIEFKNETGRQSKDQENFERQIKKRKGNYLLVRSIDELKEKLHETLQHSLHPLQD